MASRRDELNAYSFARKRTVASFLKPLPNGSMESAPRPLRTVMPSVILGMLILAGFGACGIIKPTAPQGWDNPGEKVIVGDQSTTRYVVLNNGEKDENGKQAKLLHPVLNLASAKLLLDPEKFEVVKVKESELDGGGIPMGPTIGIPYAPDRLPDEDDAGTRKTWAVCERPGAAGGSQVQKAVFVMSDQDRNHKRLVSGAGRLDERKSLFIEDEEGAQYLVDHLGVAHRLDGAYGLKEQGQSVSAAVQQQLDDLLRRILFGQRAEPQQVTADWMNTLTQSPLPVFLPQVPGTGEPSSAMGVPEAYRTVGKVLETNDDGGTQKYVVLEDELAPVSDFVAELLLEGPVGTAVNGGGSPEAVRVPQADILPSDEGFMEQFEGGQVPWPQEKSTRANNFEEQDGNRAICSVYGGDGADGEAAPGEATGSAGGSQEASTWAGRDYPATITEGGSSTYVSPGSGLLYRQVTGQAKTGPLFLVTDTGLRYSVQVNNDSERRSGRADQEQNQAQVRLGYGDISRPPLVPRAWSELLSAGPSLNTDAARQPQGS